VNTHPAQESVAWLLLFYLENIIDVTFFTLLLSSNIALYQFLSQRLLRSYPGQGGIKTAIFEF
jgi:hypothetical protein